MLFLIIAGQLEKKCLKYRTELLLPVAITASNLFSAIAPAKKRMFYTYGKGSSFELKGKKLEILNCSKKTQSRTIKFVSYSNELKPEIEKIHEKLGVTQYVKMKSSLKFCVIASGEFDGYVAEPRACEWDIAAGHAILENAGGILTDFDGNKILYGKENFLFCKNRFFQFLERTYFLRY